MKHKLFLLAVMLLMNWHVFAASGTCGENLTWDLTDGVLTISGTGEMNTYAKGNAPWYSSRSSITSVVIGNGVTHIGNYAFSGCTGLTSVTIPNSVTSIGQNAFSGCTGITSVIWNAKSAPSYAFGSQVESFTFGNEVEVIHASCCSGMSKLTNITIPNSVTSIGDGAFSGCTGLTSVTIGNSVTSIGRNAFSGCTGLKSVIWKAKNCNRVEFGTQVESFVFGDEVEQIPAYLCYEMSKLTNITIPNSVTSIGSSAFYGCTGLSFITIPNNIKGIGGDAFKGCIGLKSVIWKAKNCNRVEFGTQVESFVFGDEVEQIPAYLCYEMSSLTSITIPNSVTSIGDYAFSGCTGLTSVTIPNSVTSIGYSAFYGCTGLTSVTWNAKKCSNFSSESKTPFYDVRTQITSFVFGDEVKQIPVYLCFGMTGLTSIEIPNSVTSIGQYAFYGCTGLTPVTIPNSVANIGENAFKGVLKIMYSGTATGSPWGAKNLNNGYVDGWFVYSDASKTTLLACSSAAEGEVVIPNSVTSIGEYAFDGCRSLTSIEIPNSVTSIGSYAFSGCTGLTSVTIGNSVTSIGSRAFSGCTGLTSVTWNAKNCSNFSSASYAPFYKMRTQITSFVFGDEVEQIPAYLCYEMSSLTSIIIPNSVTSIGNSAFSGCTGLTSVTIPTSVTSIANYAFSGCTGLTKVLWNAHNADIPASVFPSNLDSLIIGEGVEEVGLYFQPQHFFELRNPLTRVGMHATPKSTSFYDYNHDGTMEFVDTVTYKIDKESRCNMRLKNLYGFSVSDDLLDAAYTDLQTINLNNDNIIDFIAGSILFQSNSNGGYDKIELDYTKTKNEDYLFALDADLNGTTDFYSYENGVHYLHLRQFDGSYFKTELNILTDTAAIDSAIYASWDKPVTGFIIIAEDHLPSLSESMFIGGNVAKSDDFNSFDTAIDLDKNGLVDLLSSTTGAVLYNIGDNTFIQGSFPGGVTAKDINGDGILDYVIYNKSTKTVSLNIYEGNGNTTTKTLMQNMNISNVWCYDFDNDGDVDILLPFDWTEASGYAFLVFWRNDGNNTFKKIENAFDDPIKHFQFLDCRDVDNDGKYEIIARDSLGSNTIYNGNYYLIRYNTHFKVNMTEPFVENSLNSNKFNNPLFVYGDFDNNGVNDYYYANGSNAYTLAHSPYTAINTAPNKMSQPRINVDAEKAMLSIDWDRGSDAQTSSLDLEYSIRIGSKPSACDMWFAAANADGKQRSLWGANVGAYLNQIVNVSGWKEGDYYISVQAIDPNGLGGEWSDEVVYHHTLLPFGFNISNHNITTADTITVQFAGTIDDSNTYSWDFGDSAIVLSQHEQTYTILYTTQGDKRISLQITSADGRKSPLVTQEVNVLPLRFEKNPNYPNNRTDPYFTLSYFDMDMDGILDGIGYQTNWSGYVKEQQGFFKGRGDGSFIKLAKTYNADLQVTGPIGDCVFADVNMDGLPDVVTKTSKGSIIYNMEDFDVEFSNDTYTLPSTPTPQYDFNNDGKADSYSIKNEHTILLHLQTEKGEEKVEVYLPSDFALNSLYQEDLIASHDFDNNGHIDFISTGTKYGTDVFIIYIHDDYNVTCQYIDESVYKSIYNIDTTPFADLNSDGVPDLNEYILKSNIANAAPATPSNLRAVQESDGVYLYWDAAKDKETPAAQIRYNISVKKQGVAVGTDHAFVVSPMNGLYDEAAIIPGYYYPQGTSYFIPIDQLTGGQTYEFQIQSIDLWNAHSPMSSAYTFTVQPQVLISMPAQTCMNEPVSVKYIGTNNGGLSWNFDGGVASLNEDGTYSVYWSTGGVKTITATLNSNTASRDIYVKNLKKDLSFTLPDKVLNNSWNQVTLPANYENLADLAIRTSSNCTGYVLPKKDSRIFQVRFKSASSDDSETGWVEFYQNDAVCGEMNTFRASTIILGKSSTPAISLVTVDATTGKNMITWDAPANLPSYIDSVIIYKEEGKSNNWIMQAKVPVSAGQWIDNASDPSVKSNSYCIAYTSIYGGESPKSAAHKIPHLQTNYGLKGTINLYWTSYQGDVVETYQILRGTSTSNLKVLATVAGDESTYTDNSPLENAYYAIAYSNAAFKEEWVCGSKAANAPVGKSMKKHAGNTRTGYSNIMASAASLQTTLAVSMTILSMEKTYTLSPSQTALHLYAEITPSYATYKQVKWQIVSGHEIATINNNGLLAVNSEGKNGTVHVRATAIDGSGVYAEQAVEVTGFKKTLSLSVNDAEMGSVNGAGQYTAGQIVTISAIAYEGYHFVQWSDGNTDNPRTVVFMQDTAFTAEFAKNVYAITWKNDDGSIIDQTEVEYGSLPTHADPNKPATAQYTYTFAGWTPEIVAATGNATYTATYNSTINKYTITFKNGDEVLQSTEVEYGVVPTYNGATPTKPGDAQYTYSFAGWDHEIVAVTENATYSAIFNSTINKYTITFLDDNGSVLATSQWNYGSTPTCAEPTKPATAQYTYTFAGWTPEVVAVNSDATYTATYSSVLNTYDITFEVKDNPTISYTIPNVPYGTLISTLLNQVKEALGGDTFEDDKYIYTFAGLENVTSTDFVTGSTTYYVLYTKTEKTSTGFDGVESAVKVTKFLRDGQILIQKGDKTFDLRGQEVR